MQGIQGDPDSPPTSQAQSKKGYERLPYENEPELRSPMATEKKKKFALYGVIGALALIALIIIIVEVVSGGKIDDGGDNPPGPDPKPPVPEGINYFNVEAGSQISSPASISGIMVYTPKLTSSDEAGEDGALKEDLKVGVDSATIINAIGTNNEFVPRVRYTFGQVDPTQTVLQLTDAVDENRYSAPDHLVNRSQPQAEQRLDKSNFQILEQPFSFSFASAHTGEKMIDTQNQTFIYQDRYIQIDFQVSSEHIFGFGQRLSKFKLEEGAYTMWNYKNGQIEDDVGRGGTQMQGMHPFCLIKAQNSSEYLGMYFRSTNAQAPVLRKNGTKTILSYITTGGNLDINFFFKGSAKDVIARYQRFIGLPSLPPLWAMGWRSANNNINNITDLQNLVDNYQSTGCLDIIELHGQYQNNYSSFTVDQQKFAGLKEYVETLHQQGKRLVLDVSGGLSNESPPSKYRIMAQQSLIMNETKIFEAPQNQNSTVFLDWFNSQSQDIWQQGLHDLYDLVPFDGINLVDNAPTIDCDGGPSACNIEQMPKDFTLKEDNKDTSWYLHYGADRMTAMSTYYLPFIPQAFNLDKKTIALNATHRNDTSGKQFKEYDVHSLFGHMQSQATVNALTNQTTGSGDINPTADFRQYITSESTYAGSGKYAQNILSGTLRNWDHLKLTISYMMNQNLQGMPFSGVDVCGTYQDPQLSSQEQEHVCNVWYELATVFPIVRTNSKSGIDIEQTNSAIMSDKVLTRTKYQYLLHIYGCLFEASQTGQTCFDPLFYHFGYPLENIEDTFIVADSIKVSPALDWDSYSSGKITSFFPKGRWVSLSPDNNIINVEEPEGRNVTLNHTQRQIEMHIIPGAMVAEQIPNENDQIEALANLSVNLHFNPDENNFAKGKLFLDRGMNMSEINDKTYVHYEFQLSGFQVTKTDLNNNADTANRQNVTQMYIHQPEWKNAAYKFTNACFVAEDNSFYGINFYSDTAGEHSQFIIGDDSAQTSDVKAIDIHNMKMIQICGSFMGLPLSDCMCDTETFAAYKYSQDYNKTAMLNESSNSTFILTSRDQSGGLDIDSYKVKIELGDSKHSDPSYQSSLPLINIKITKNYLFNSNDASSHDSVFEVPEDIVNVTDSLLCQNAETCILSDYVDIDTSENPEYLVKIMSNATFRGQVPVWTLNTFEHDQAIQQNSDHFTFINTTVMGNDQNFKGIMGLTDRPTEELFLGDGRYGLWTRSNRGDVPGMAASSDDVHPFYMAQASDQTWFGVYTNLAAAQDWLIQNDQAKSTVNVTTFANGGCIDITILFGADPNEVVRRYHALIGRPVLPPFWALGWGQGRLGLNNEFVMEIMVDQYKKYNLPLETIWHDIDYMDEGKAFTIDNVDFANLKDFVENNQQEQRHYIPIVNPQIAERPNSDYTAYNTGVEQDVFRKAYVDGPDFTGKGTANDVVYPNFFANQTKAWWNSNLDAFYQATSFDALWLESNEALNLCNGVCYREQVAPNPAKKSLRYIPATEDLETQTLPLDSWSYNVTYYNEDGSIRANISFTELDTHSLYGTVETQLTNEWAQNVSNLERPLIFSRSTFAGAGKYGSTLYPDTYSDYLSMARSVTGVMMSNVFGFPLTGADICGYYGNVTEELCTRWHALGAFYPLSRNYYGINKRDQEPYVFTNISSYGTFRYIDAIRNSMRTKLALVNYYYTELFHISTEEGGAFFRPLFFDFPQNKESYEDQTNNVMLGSSLKLSIQTQGNINETLFIFPEGTWCNVFNASAQCEEGPTKIWLPSRDYQFHVHIRQGSIVPLNTKVLDKNTHNLQQNANTTYDVREYFGIELHIHTDFELNLTSQNALGGSCNASGRFVTDDGGPVGNLSYNKYQFDFSSACEMAQNASNITLKVNAERQGDEYVDDQIEKIVIYNANSTNFNMYDEYLVTMYFKEGGPPEPVTSIQHSVYNAQYNQQIFEPVDFEYAMYLIDYITYTPVPQSAAPAA